MMTGLRLGWPSFHFGTMRASLIMFSTYILRSIDDPDRHYIGYTADLKTRLAEHNSGKCMHTSKYAPWTLQCYFAFESESLARNFERYLKSGSGRAFAKRHFST